MSNNISKALGVYTKGGPILTGEIVEISNDVNRNFLTISNNSSDDLKIFMGYDLEELPEQDTNGNYMTLKGVRDSSKEGQYIWNPYPIPTCQIHLLPSNAGESFEVAVATDSKVAILQYSL